MADISDGDMGDFMASSSLDCLASGTSIGCFFSRWAWRVLVPVSLPYTFSGEQYLHTAAPSWFLVKCSQTELDSCFLRGGEVGEEEAGTTIGRVFLLLLLTEEVIEVSEVVVEEEEEEEEEKEEEGEKNEGEEENEGEDEEEEEDEEDEEVEDEDEDEEVEVEEAEARSIC